MTATPLPHPAADPLAVRVAAAVAGRYALEDEIGRGAMSAVYRARDLRLRRLVAIKVLPPELAYRDDVRRRFAREAETAAQLSHPHVVPIYEVDERDGVVYFAMALVEGDSLGARLAREPRPAVDVVRRIVAAVADALDYAHGRGVVHRDVKPDNILLDATSGRALVTDFGIARAAEADGRLTATGVAVGTPAYMSPEQAIGEADVDGRSDVYSLGVVAYQMLAGAPPFAANNTPSMLMKQLTERARPLRELRPDAPADLVAAVERAMQKSPADRWATAGAFRDAVTGGAGSVAADARASSAGRHDAEVIAAASRVTAAAAAQAPAARPAVAAPPPYPPLPPLPPYPVHGSVRERVAWRQLKIEQRAEEMRRSAEWQDQVRATWSPQWLPADARRSVAAARDRERPVSERIARFRRKAAGSTLGIGFLVMVNIGTGGFPWAVFPVIAMFSGILREWRSVRRAGVSRGAALIGDPLETEARLAAGASAPRAGPTPEERVASFRRTAAIAAGAGAVGFGSLVVGASLHLDPMIAPAVLGSLTATVASVTAMAKAMSLRRMGIRVRDALGSEWRRSAALADRRPRAELVAETARRVAAADVLEGPYGDAVRRAAGDRADVSDVLTKLSESDRSLIPDVLPTVDALVDRIGALATALHQIDADLPGGAPGDLDRRIEAARASTTAEAPRTLALLERQRQTLGDLAARRTRLATQFESATLALQNVKLDLLKLRSSGVGASLGDVTSATQEARALSRDIGYVLDAAGELRRL